MGIVELVVLGMVGKELVEGQIVVVAGMGKEVVVDQSQNQDLVELVDMGMGVVAEN